MSFRTKGIIYRLLLIAEFIILTVAYYNFFLTENEEKEKDDQIKELYEISSRVVKDNSINLKDYSKENIEEYAIFYRDNKISIKFYTNNGSYMEITVNENFEVIDMNCRAESGIILYKLLISASLAMLTVIVTFLLVLIIKNE